MASSGMALGFVIFKSEYYGLPTFLANITLAVGGLFVAASKDLNISSKLALAFFLPPTGMTIGIFTIEAWFFDNPNIPMDIYYGGYETRILPSMYQLKGALVGGAIFYLFIAFGMPFDWIIPKDVSAFENLITDSDESYYPVDAEEDNNANKVLLDVRNISHVYADGTHAVKNISFKIREGEILSYLGANGGKLQLDRLLFIMLITLAGKSTTMGMLCGTLKATVGDAQVGDFSITSNMTKARRSLGICTQQDVLWGDLSVREHLLIFGFLRGTSFWELASKVQQMIHDLGFPEKANFMTSQLSGGQKRRLCAGISMIGNNKVVYLDEVSFAFWSCLP
jgi:ABC-type Na+ transport system ATPase subunit NatA